MGGWVIAMVSPSKVARTPRQRSYRTDGSIAAMELLLSGIEASTPMIEAATALMSARQSMGGTSAVEPVTNTNKRPRKPAGTVGQAKEKTTKKPQHVKIQPAIPADGGAVSGANGGWHVPVAAPVAAQHRPQYQQQQYQHQQYQQLRQPFQPNTPVTYQHNQYQHNQQNQQNQHQHQLQHQKLQEQQQKLQQQRVQQQQQQETSPSAAGSSVQSFQAGPLQHQLLRRLQQQLHQYNDQRQLQQHQQQQHARQQYAQHVQQQVQRQQMFQMQQELKQKQQQELQQQQQQQQELQQQRQQERQQQQELQQQRQLEFQQQRQLEYQQQLQQHLQRQQQQELRQRQQQELRQQQQQELQQQQQQELQQQQQQREFLRQQQLQQQKQQQQQREEQRQYQQQQQRQRHRQQQARRMQQQLKQQQMQKMQEEFQQQEQRSAVIRPGSSIVPPPYQRQPHLLEIDPRLRNIPGVPVLMHGDILRPVPPLRQKQPVKSNESQSRLHHGQSQAPAFQMQQRQRPPMVSKLNLQRPQLSNEGGFQHAFWPNEHHSSPAASAVSSSFTGVPHQPASFGETANTGIQSSVLPSLRFRTQGETFELTSLVRTQGDTQDPSQFRIPRDEVGVNQQPQSAAENILQNGSKHSLVGGVVQSSAVGGSKPRSKHLSNNRLRKMNKQTERKEKRDQKELQKIKAMLQPPTPQQGAQNSDIILTPQQRERQDAARLKALAKRIDRGASLAKAVEHVVQLQDHAREQGQLLRQAQLAMLANQQLQNRNPFEFPPARPLPPTVPRSGASTTSEPAAVHKKRPREYDEQVKGHTVAVPGGALVWKGVDRELQRGPPKYPTPQPSSSMPDTALGHEVQPRELASGAPMAQAQSEIRMVPEAAYNPEGGGKIASSIAKPTAPRPRRRKPAVPAFIPPIQPILPKNPADKQMASFPTSVPAPSSSVVDRVDGQVVGGVHAASHSASNQVVHQSTLVDTPVARPESDTVMVFCKRDFMRFQAGLLWRKYQEIKRKRDQTLATVTGRRARYLSARYQDPGKRGSTMTTGKRAGKRTRNGDELTRNNVGVVEILDDDDEGESESVEAEATSGDAANQSAATDQASMHTNDTPLQPAARNEALMPTSDLTVRSTVSNEASTTTICSSLETPASNAATIAMDSSLVQSTAPDEAMMKMSSPLLPSEATMTSTSSSPQSAASDEAILTMSSLSLQPVASQKATMNTSSLSLQSAASDEASMMPNSSLLQPTASGVATLATSKSSLQLAASGEATLVPNSSLLQSAASDEASTFRQTNEHIEVADLIEIRQHFVPTSEEKQQRDLRDDEETICSGDDERREDSRSRGGELVSVSLDTEVTGNDESATLSTDLTNETTAPSETTSSPDDDWYSSVELIEADGTAVNVVRAPVVVSLEPTPATTRGAVMTAAPLLSRPKDDVEPHESEPSESAINGIREEVVI